LASVAAWVGLATGSVRSADQVEFARDIVPLIEQHCIRCHKPGNEKGDLSLATSEDLTANGYVTPGKPEESHLVDVVTAASGQRPAMPKEGAPLSAAEVDRLRRWIADGAPWPDSVVVRERAKADATWWSLQPLAATEPPAPGAMPAAWQAHPIDRFVFQKLADKGLSPSPQADKRTLIRRVTYDLIGLPPTPEQVEAFVADDAPDAYQELVDRLLASPQYGEQWGRHWLDVVRFGESRGFERNEIIDNAWPFRDYVIRSLNEDKSFDVLVREHLAGDVIGKDQPGVEVGVTFLVGGPYDDVGNQDAAQAAQIRANTIDEMIRATAEAFLGLTVGCARCHDHKFDPVLQRDYYGLYATFAGVHHGSRAVATEEQRLARDGALRCFNEARDQLAKQLAALDTATAREDKSQQADLNRRLAEVNRQINAVPPLPTWWVGEFKPIRDKFQVFLGGDPQRRGAEVVPASLSALDAVAPPYRLSDDAAEGQRRLQLAEWITCPKNPLTPRVLANRIWHYHFGTGIVETPSDFGYMGGRPTHPELLDWLAGQIHQHGWRLKPLHRQILLSETYRQSSAFRADAAAVDADSRYLWRFPPRRLAAEEIRDTMLSVAGKLDPKMGGPGFRLYRYLQDNVSTYIPLDEHGPETYRRAVYHQKARASLLDLLTEFDCPDNSFSAPRRAATTTPLQALTLLNHRFSIDMASGLAERLKQEAGADRTEAQVRRAFALAYSRQPAAEEIHAAVALIGQHGLRAFCRALLNSNEMIYLR
jgi:mono/diheme cytochrome c family protein